MSCPQSNDENPFISKSNNFLDCSSVNKDLLFGASVAELRRKAQEHSAALWQSLQLAQQQSMAATTNLATALTTSSCNSQLSSPFLLSNSNNDSKEINFNFLPNVSGLGGFAGLGFSSHFPQLANPNGDENGAIPSKSFVEIADEKPVLQPEEISKARSNTN